VGIAACGAVESLVMVTTASFELSSTGMFGGRQTPWLPAIAYLLAPAIAVIATRRMWRGQFWNALCWVAPPYLLRAMTWRFHLADNPIFADTMSARSLRTQHVLTWVVIGVFVVVWALLIGKDARGVPAFVPLLALYQFFDDTLVLTNVALKHMPPGWFSEPRPRCPGLARRPRNEVAPARCGGCVAACAACGQFSRPTFYARRCPRARPACGRFTRKQYDPGGGGRRSRSGPRPEEHWGRRHTPPSRTESSFLQAAGHVVR
jgi:hypothetical protein